MREEPVISGGVLKLALVLLVAGGLGVGAYAVAGGGLDLPDLPDLPEIETAGETTQIEEGDFEDTNLGEDDGSGEAAAPFTSAGLAAALAAVRDEIGNVELTRLTVNEAQTQLLVRRGNGIEAYTVSGRSGDLIRENASITISGDASVADFAFPLAGVQAAAVDRMVSAARKKSGDPDFRPTVLTLERGIPVGERALRWTISAEGGGRFLTYRAEADGRGVEDAGGGGTEIPPSAQEARRLNECIADAGDDTDAVFACLDDFE
jgi:hypothetical protein